MEDYDIISIKGKHGMINLHVPKKAATQDEIDDIYKAVAEIAINKNKNQKTAK